MTNRLLEFAGLRRLDAGTDAPVADATRAVLGVDQSTYPVEGADLPRIALGDRVVAAGLSLEFGAIATGTGSLAESGTATIPLYGEEPVAGRDYNETTGVLKEARLRLLGTLTATMGNKLETVWVGGESGGAVQLRMADTLSLSLSPYGTLLLDTTYGAPPQVFSPESNGVGELVLPQLPGLSALVLDAQTDAAAVLYVNARRIG